MVSGSPSRSPNTGFMTIRSSSWETIFSDLAQGASFTEETLNVTVASLLSFFASETLNVSEVHTVKVLFWEIGQVWCFSYYSTIPWLRGKSVKNCVAFRIACF